MMANRIELMNKIKEIDNLIASGITNARDADGKSVTYRSLDDLHKMKERLTSELRSAKGYRRPMGRTILVSRGL